jgi:hypothetical protein
MGGNSQPAAGALQTVGGVRYRAGHRLQFFGALVLVLFALPLALIAGFLAWRQYRILKTWPAVDATVVQSRWVESRSRPGPGRGDSYGAEFQFRYSVAGREYEAIARPGYSSSYDQARRWLGELPVGSRRRIRYEPDNPQVISLANDYGTLSFAASYALARWVLIIAAASIVLIVAGRRLERGRVAGEFPGAR